MTDEIFILILKARLKQYYQEGKSVGLELRALVAQFRQEIEDDILKFKYREKNESNTKNRSRNAVSHSQDHQ
ncbi:hypothetical protein [Chryseobacterium sp. R2A-55]|uniref:hypothetical protein n=1 Tax=Chryseobacterium sp. R2A-55 TaxID=2744445 RepID=UPI001F36284D|nr:hypothetical protein [Chryseobacterium sp. R2A-55]